MSLRSRLNLYQDHSIYHVYSMRCCLYVQRSISVIYLAILGVTEIMSEYLVMRYENKTLHNFNIKCECFKLEE